MPYPFGERRNEGDYQVYGEDPTKEYLQDEAVFCPACGGIDTQLSKVDIPSEYEVWTCRYCRREWKVKKNAS